MEMIYMESLNSGSFKVFVRDTMNNWIEMMFVTKYRFNCFLKQSHIDTFTEAFREFESLGFEFGDFSYGHKSPKSFACKEMWLFWLDASCL